MAKSKTPKQPTAAERKQLLETLAERFEAHPERHKGVAWSTVSKRLEANPDKVATLHHMEQTGGEPDVVGQDAKSKDILFFDCAEQSPDGRRSLCYDGEALASRKKHKPEGSAVERATEMGAKLLTEAQYRRLQELGEFDTKTSSWLQTPEDIRALGGAIFGDRRFDTVFIYHNGAESYYGARGFRCAVGV